MNIADVVRAYHDARFRGDVAAAVALTGTPFQFRSPMLRSDDPAGHLAGLPGFLSIVTGVELRSELYGTDEATLVYDVHTASPVGTQRTAEHFRLTGGLITSITLIFDATPWQALRSAVVG
ncbi:hypothetical protein AB0H83_28810 [Dactylosporangium sp. NPDC050688]|uniref:hypothetical protein n=1 Tax=Dactylosporangium sp. NPDC050688 TaxID=3157217 RepID=UPI0033F17D8A